MGYLFSKIANLFSTFNDEKRIVMLSLDGSGKTTILYRLHLGEVVSTTPTIGFSVEKIHYKNIEMTVWDLGGQEKLRQLWFNLLEGTHALIYVVDSADVDRLDESKEELYKIAQVNELKKIPILIFANKTDLPNAMSIEKLMESFELKNNLKDNDWYVQPCSALTGDGLHEGLDWLVRALNRATLL